MIKVGNKMVGESASEQYKIERRRFKARQAHSRNKIQAEEDPKQLKFNMEENL